MKSGTTRRATTTATGMIVAESRSASTLLSAYRDVDANGGRVHNGPVSRVLAWYEWRALGGATVKNPPILISVLGFFAALAGFGFLFYGLRVIGFDWFGVLGDLPAYENSGLWGWLSVATGIVWLLAAGGLWSLQPWARTFTMIIAGFALFEAVLAFFQFPGTGIGFAMALMPAFVLWYLSSEGVAAAFGANDQAV